MVDARDLRETEQALEDAEADLRDALARIAELEEVERAAQTYVMAGLCGNVDIRTDWARLVEVARTDLDEEQTVHRATTAALEDSAARIIDLEAEVVVLRAENEKLRDKRRHDLGAWKHDPNGPAC